MARREDARHQEEAIEVPLRTTAHRPLPTFDLLHVTDRSGGRTRHLFCCRKPEQFGMDRVWQPNAIGLDDEEPWDPEGQNILENRLRSG